MATAQEQVDRELRMTLGDMHVQMMFLRARIAELEEQLGNTIPGEAPVEAVNGTGKPPAKGKVLDA